VNVPTSEQWTEFGLGLTVWGEADAPAIGVAEVDLWDGEPGFRLLVTHPDDGGAWTPVPTCPGAEQWYGAPLDGAVWWFWPVDAQTVEWTGLTW
ncbi:MAG: hypothetical protein ABMA64_35100, partial [Myxococcota bacterium]